LLKLLIAHALFFDLLWIWSGWHSWNIYSTEPLTTGPYSWKTRFN